MGLRPPTRADTPRQPVTAAPTLTRIVHIDPEPDYRYIVAAALEAEPTMTVVGAADDLTGACTTVRELQPDVALADPFAGIRADVEGLTCLQAAAPDVRLVLLTDLPGPELDWTAHLAGARGQLSKRVRPSRLARELRQLLDVLDVVGGALDEARTELDPELVSPRRARAFVNRALERWDCADATAIIELLVSEIVANAVLHAETPAELTVQLLPERVRVAVTDEDVSHPKRRQSGPLTSSGRGLALIETLSLAWGIDRLAGGKRIWFETPRPGLAGDAEHEPAS
jgi:anti-sigma regulatory factor (Ser/Thr protein kinase)